MIRNYLNNISNRNYLYNNYFQQNGGVAGGVARHLLAAASPLTVLGVSRGVAVGGCGQAEVCSPLRMWVWSSSLGMVLKNS